LGGRDKPGHDGDKQDDKSSPLSLLGRGLSAAILRGEANASRMAERVRGKLTLDAPSALPPHRARIFDALPLRCLSAMRACALPQGGER
jgi:hypothetical protein